MNARAKDVENKNLAKFKRLQKRSKMNAREIAELLGYQPNTIRKWRCGLIQIPDRALTLLELLLPK